MSEYHLNTRYLLELKVIGVRSRRNHDTPYIIGLYMGCRMVDAVRRLRSRFYDSIKIIVDYLSSPKYSSVINDIITITQSHRIISNPPFQCSLPSHSCCFENEMSPPPFALHQSLSIGLIGSSWSYCLLSILADISFPLRRFAGRPGFNRVNRCWFVQRLWPKMVDLQSLVDRGGLAA